MRSSLSEVIANETMVVTKEQLPLTIVYHGKRYVLVRTKQDKLLLNKAVSSSAS